MEVVLITGNTLDTTEPRVNVTVTVSTHRLETKTQVLLLLFIEIGLLYRYDRRV